MGLRRYLIYSAIAVIIGIAVIVCCMFLFSGITSVSQTEVQTRVAVPTAAGMRCTCGGSMYSTGMTAATCTSPGIETYTCSSCGKIMTMELSDSPALGHLEITDQAVPATCTAEGLTEGSHCSRCGMVFEEQETLPALGHDIVILSAVVPTCTEGGRTEGSYCNRCGTMLEAQVALPALGHSWSDWEDSRTSCDESGIRTRSCSVCGEEETEELPAGTHTWDSGTVVKQPDCMQSGTMRFTCTMCGDTSTEDIDPLGHNLTHYAAVEPAEDKEGNIEYWQCKRCGKYFSDKDGINEIDFSEIPVPYSSNNMPAFKIVLAVASGVLLFVLICAAACNLLSRKKVSKTKNR